MFKKVGILICNCSAVIVSLVFQSAGEDVKDTLRSLDGIVVTGTKTEKTIQSAPVKTDVIGRKDIEKFAACNLYQVLDNFPGIRMEQQCNNCNFSLLRMNGLEGGYAKILIDGMPVYSGLAGVYGMQQIQASLIDRVEIVKGAGSALYGSDAVAGVINVITRRPSPRPMITIDMSAGVNPFDDEDRYGSMPIMSNVSVTASHRKGDFAAVAAMQANTADEIDNNGDNATDRVQSKNLGGTAKLYWYDCLGDKSTVGLMGRAIYEQRKGGGIKKDKNGNYPIDNPLSTEGPGSEHIITERLEGGLSIEKVFVSLTKINAVLNAVSHERSATNAAAWEKSMGETLNYSSITEEDISEISKIIPQPFLTSERTVVGEVNITQPAGDVNTILAGVQVKRTDIDENINADGWFNRYFQDIGFFLQDEWDIFEKSALVAGLRYDMHKSIDELVDSDYKENSLNPRVSFRYSPLKSLTTRVSWGTGFRVPGDFSEDAHLCASAPKIKKSSSLEPEKSMSYNISADFSKGGFSAELGLFRTDIEDKVILSDYEGTGYDLEWVNSEGKAFTQGIELNGKYEKKYFNAGAGYVFTDAQYDEEQMKGNSKSKYIPRSPEHTAHLDLGLSTERKGKKFINGWSIDVGLNFIGSMYIERDGDIVESYSLEGIELDQIAKTDPYVLLDARINKHFSSTGFDIYLSAENLTNTVQDRKQWDIDDAAMMYAPIYGTTVSFGVKKVF